MAKKTVCSIFTSMIPYYVVGRINASNIVITMIYYFSFFFIIIINNIFFNYSSSISRLLLYMLLLLLFVAYHRVADAVVGSPNVSL